MISKHGRQKKEALLRASRKQRIARSAMRAEEMSVDNYIEQHWIKNRIWEHLSWEKHQLRLKICAGYAAEDSASYADIGCACGHSTSILKMFRPGNWIGIDFSARAIAEAKRLFVDIDFLHFKSFAELAQSGLSFDSVVCSEVIEHCADEQGLVSALIAIARKRIVLTTPNRRVSDPGHLRVYQREQLSSLFSAIKHRIIELDPFFYLIGEK